MGKSSFDGCDGLGCNWSGVLGVDGHASGGDGGRGGSRGARVGGRTREGRIDAIFRWPRDGTHASTPHKRGEDGRIRMQRLSLGTESLCPPPRSLNSLAKASSEYRHKYSTRIRDSGLFVISGMCAVSVVSISKFYSISPLTTFHVMTL